MNLWLHRLRAIRRRQLLALAAGEGLLLAAGLATLWTLATLLVRLLCGLPPQPAWPWGLALSLPGAALLLLALRRDRLSLDRAAEAADRFLGNPDLMATALWLHRQRPFPSSGALVLQRAQAAGARLDPRKAAGLWGGRGLLIRLAALAVAALLGIGASLVPLPPLGPASGPPAPTAGPLLPPPPAPPPAIPPQDQEDPRPLGESLQQLGEELAQGETTPQAAREALDRFLRNLETAPGSGPRAPLSPLEQEALEALLRQILGRPAGPSGLPGTGQEQGRAGEAGDQRPSPGGRSGLPEVPSGPGEPRLDPGPGQGRDPRGPEGQPAPGQGAPGPSQGESPQPPTGDPGAEGSPQGRAGEEPLQGRGPLPGTEPGEPLEGSGSLPPPAATTGEPDLLPSEPGAGPYTLGEGPQVAPVPGQEPPPLGPAEGVPEGDPGEAPVPRPMLPALYREWLQRYFTPAPAEHSGE